MKASMAMRAQLQACKLDGNSGTSEAPGYALSGMVRHGVLRGVVQQRYGSLIDADSDGVQSCQPPFTPHQDSRNAQRESAFSRHSTNARRAGMQIP